jgi:hypothetical protein
MLMLVLLLQRVLLTLWVLVRTLALFVSSGSGVIADDDTAPAEGHLADTNVGGGDNSGAGATYCLWWCELSCSCCCCSCCYCC